MNENQEDCIWFFTAGMKFSGETGGRQEGWEEGRMEDERQRQVAKTLRPKGAENLKASGAEEPLLGSEPSSLGPLGHVTLRSRWTHFWGTGGEQEKPAGAT